MQRAPVISSNVASVGYDPEQQHLEVEFKNGGVYRYTGVPPEAHVALLGADSIGQHLHRHVKGVYDVEKVS